MNIELYTLQKKLNPILTVSERSKHLFKAGVAGQGFVGFLDVETGIIELVPAWNKDDGKERKPLYYQGKYYGVESIEKLGSNSGDAHVKGLAQIALAHKGGVNGGILGFGIFKDSDGDIEQLRNRSASQNLFSIKYQDIFLLMCELPLALQRSIPFDLTQRIAEALHDQLNLSKEIPFNCGGFQLEEIFRQLTNSKIENLLISRILLCKEDDNGSAEMFQRVIEQANKYFPHFISNVVKTIITARENQGWDEALFLTEFLITSLNKFHWHHILHGYNSLLATSSLEGEQTKLRLLTHFKVVLHKLEESNIESFKFTCANRLLHVSEWMLVTNTFSLEVLSEIISKLIDLPAMYFQNYDLLLVTSILQKHPEALRRCHLDKHQPLKHAINTGNIGLVEVFCVVARKEMAEEIDEALILKCVRNNFYKKIGKFLIKTYIDCLPAKLLAVALQELFKSVFGDDVKLVKFILAKRPDVVEAMEMLTGKPPVLMALDMYCDDIEIIRLLCMNQLFIDEKYHVMIHTIERNEFDVISLFITEFVHQFSRSELLESICYLADTRIELALLLLAKRIDLFQNRQEIETVIKDLKVQKCNDEELYDQLNLIKKRFPTQINKWWKSVATFFGQPEVHSLPIHSVYKKTHKKAAGF